MSGVGIVGTSNASFLAALQNVVTALNTQTQNAINLAGAQAFYNVASITQVKSGAGRLVNISVIIAGSSDGGVYDSASLADTTRPIFVIPDVVGVYVVNIPFQYGLVVRGGTGMTVAGSYS